jgi:hypothetical protein
MFWLFAMWIGRILAWLFPGLAGLGAVDAWAPGDLR